MATDKFLSGPILEEYVRNLTDRLMDDYSNQLFFREYPKPDFHTQEASKMFRVPVDEVTTEMRNSSKYWNYHKAYGNYSSWPTLPNFTFTSKRKVMSLTSQGINEWTQEKPNERLASMLNAIEMANKSFQGIYEPTWHSKKQRKEDIALTPEGKRLNHWDAWLAKAEGKPLRVAHNVCA
jgi:hypothetical protein